MAKIKVENAEITVVSVQNEDYISLTDMAHSQMQEHIVFRWMSLKSTIEYLGEWEMLYNPNFNCTEFDTIRNSAGSNNFVLSVKAWIERNCSVKRSDVLAVLAELSDVIAQKLADSHRVRLAGIGSLMVGLNGQPCSDPTQYDASYITGLHLCFKPEKELRLTDADVLPLPP